MGGLLPALHLVGRELYAFTPIVLRDRFERLARHVGRKHIKFAARSRGHLGQAYCARRRTARRGASARVSWVTGGPKSTFGLGGVGSRMRTWGSTLSRNLLKADPRCQMPAARGEGSV